MDSIVTAGGRLKAEDPLFELTGVEKKALIPIAGKSMVSWVLDALRGSNIVDNIIIVGLQPDELDYEDDHLFFADAVGGMVDNILVGTKRLAEINPALTTCLLSSSDIPLITPEIVRGFVDECGDQSGDMYYAIVEEKTMEARFPGSKRTFVPLKDGRYSGGDMILVDVSRDYTEDVEMAKSMTGSRKNYLKQARMIGFDFIIRLLFRRMTAEEAAKRASTKVNFEGRVVSTRFAELGMDLDKLHQYEMIKGQLEQREAQRPKG